MLSLPGVAIAVLVLCPFLGKAFTVDDTLFLEQAQHLLVDPWHSTAFETSWSGSAIPQRMSAIMPSGPVMPYLLLPIVSLGAHEWLAHLVELLFLCAAVVGTACLALRLGLSEVGSRAAAVLASSTPAALAMAGTAMPDIPAMSLGVLGCERLVAWWIERRWYQAVTASLLLTAAVLAQPHLILLVGLIFFARPVEASRWRQSPVSSWWPFAAVLTLLVATAVAMHDPQGTPYDFIGSASTYSSWANVASNAVAFASHWTLAIPLALPWLLLQWRRILGHPLIWFATIGAALVLNSAPDVANRSLLIAPIAGVGAAVVWDIIGEAWRQHDRLQTFLGLWLLIGLAQLPYTHLPSKYLLASTPAAAMLVGRALASRSRKFRLRALIPTLAVSISLTLLILRADSVFADLGRRAAAELIAPQVAAGNRVWFDGHWGFQWYAERAGARCLTANAPFPRPGDFVVSSVKSFGTLINMLPDRVLVTTLEDDRPGGRLMEVDADAGFYSNSWGYLPWGWSRDPVDRFALWHLE